MKQSELEQQFEQELLQNGRKAESECGCRFARLTQTVSPKNGIGGIFRSSAGRPARSLARSNGGKDEICFSFY